METSFRRVPGGKQLSVAGDVRSRILLATLTLVLGQGTRKLRSAEVARVAGTTESTVFRYYSNIECLLQATYDACWARINDFIRRSNYNDVRPRDSLGQLVATFDYFWRMRDDRELSDCVLMAFTFYRRPKELENDGQIYESIEQKEFEQHLEQLCELYIAERGMGADPKTLERLLTNFAATVWLTWELTPDADTHLSTDEARLGIISLVERLVPLPVS